MNKGEFKSRTDDVTVQASGHKAICGELNVVEDNDTLVATGTLRETPSAAANGALIALTTVIPKSAYRDALQAAYETMGFASQDQLIKWEAALSDPHAPIPDEFDSSLPRSSLLPMARRVLEGKQESKATHFNGLYTLMAAAVGGVIGAVATLILAKSF